MGALSLLAKIGVDSTDLQIGLKRASSMADKFGKNFQSAVTGQIAAAFSIAAITGFTKSIINTADEIGDLAEQLGLTNEEVQRFQVLAGQSGVKFESIASAIGKINKARIEALRSAGPERDAFAAAGITVTDLADRSRHSAEVLVGLGKILLENRNDADKMSAAYDLLGPKLVKAALAAGKFGELGPTPLFKDEDVENLGKVNDRLDLAVKQSMALTVNLARTFSESKLGKIIDFINLPTKIAQGFILQKLTSVSGAAEPSKPTPEQAKLAGKPADRFVPPTPEIVRPKLTLFQGVDPLTRIGGLTGFGGTQSEVMRQLMAQTAEQKSINRNTRRTAQVLAEE